MGTNFYLRHKISEEDKELLQKAIKEDNLPEIDRLTQCTHEIHIGKASYGWKFLWDANYFTCFKPDKESILDWLKNGVIYDEYNDEYSYNEFMQFLKERDQNPTNSWDASSYSDYCTNEGKYSGYYPRNTRFFDWFQRRFKIEPDIYGEFYIDDMRFTVDSNFS